MTTTQATSQAGSHPGYRLTVYGVALLLAFVMAVEAVNIAFYDPWGDEYFLFRLQGVLDGVDMSTLTWIMFGSLFVLLMAGLPLAFVAGGLGVVFLYLVGDSAMLNMVPSRIVPMMTNPDLAAIPLFIFMATMLERAGLIEEMFDAVYQWMGGLRGGLAVATILASTILAAMVGVVGAAIVTMGIIALPAMLKRGYDEQIALGSIMAGGALGVLIPPSILAILYAVVAQQSVGELYAGCVIPGLMLAGLYVVYVLIRSLINPAIGPAVPESERLSLSAKLILLRRLIAPILLVIVVLGLLFTGIATPVEAAGLGSFGAMFVALIHKRLTLEGLFGASLSTVKATVMVLWIIFGASIFVGLYILKGGQAFITDAMLGTGLSAYGILFLMMFLLVVLGMFLDWVGILLLAIPIFVPIIKQLSFDGVLGMPGPTPDQVLVWFGVLYLVNMQMSFLSPPFGYALFYIRGVAPDSITMGTIFKSSLVFLAIQVIALAFVIIFPALATWLPGQMYGR